MELTAAGSVREGGDLWPTKVWLAAPLGSVSHGFGWPERYCAESSKNPRSVVTSTTVRSLSRAKVPWEITAFEQAHGKRYSSTY